MKRILKFVSLLAIIFVAANFFKKKINVGCPVKNFEEKVLFAIRKFLEEVYKEGETS